MSKGTDCKLHLMHKNLQIYRLLYMYFRVIKMLIKRTFLTDAWMIIIFE